MRKLIDRSTEKSISVILAITGASGAIYGIKILDILKELKIFTHLIISRSAQITIAQELSISLNEISAKADVVHSNGNISASIASGSFLTDCMIIAPCSMKTMSEIACGTTANLITRAADVILKEHRRLLLMVREAPLHSGHLERMLHLSRLGAIIYPPMNAFYNAPQSIDDLVDYTAVRALDSVGIHIESKHRWGK